MPEASTTIDLLDELRWRGLVHQCTDDDGLRAHLSGDRRRLYCGFDPTADSLTIGNLVPIMVLVHAARHGHEPIVVMGGATGLIGDPSGKSAERRLLGREQVARHVAAQRPIFEAVFSGAGVGVPTILNNLDWLSRVSFLDALRDVGKHFSVNAMMQKDSVRERLAGRERGISYTEFSYMILQALDFAQLHLSHRVTVQVGGSDQWGNIVSGIDLIRRIHVEKPLDQPIWSADSMSASQRSAARELLERRAEAYGLTAPLVTKADGTKFGKTEAGAVWLTPERTSPYDYYQFWLGAADEDAGRYLRLFTLLDRGTIASIEADHARDPSARLAQRRLAEEATSLRYGREEATAADRASRALFSGGLAELGPEDLERAIADAPSCDRPWSELAGEGADLVSLLVSVGLASSKREAREFLAAGAIRVNGRAAGGDRLGEDAVLHGRLTVLRRGKKRQVVVRWR